MNDIDLLQAYGPDAPPVSSEALQGARARLRDEIRAPERRTRSWFSRPVRRWVAAGAGLALAGSVTVMMLVDPGSPAVVTPSIGAPAVTTAPATRPPTRPGPIKLVAMEGPAFPWSLPGLGKATYIADPDGPIIAVYLADDGSDVYLSSTTATPPGPSYRPTTVNGKTAWIGGSTVGWEQAPGRWARVTGLGRYANENAVHDLATRVRDDPQPVDLRYAVGLVPAGWELRGFKEDGAIITYVDPVVPGRDLTVAPIDGFTRRPAKEIQGFQAVSKVEIRGRQVPLIRADDFWRVELALSDGSLVQLMAPRVFTPAQMVAVAKSIRRNIR